MAAISDFFDGMHGVIFPFAGSAAPKGFLLCYGQAVSRSTYAALFGVIGTTYGVGDGSTTFNVPDLRGLVPAGLDNMGGVAANRLQVSTNITTSSGSPTATVASATGLAQGMTVTAAGVPAGTTISSISGTTLTLSANATASATVAGRFSHVGDAQSPGQSGGSQTHALVANQMPSHSHTMDANGSGSSAFMATGSGGGLLNTSSVGGNQAHPNVQPTMVMNWIIKT